MKQTLRIENLSIGYGSKSIAKGLNASAHSGELICLMGPNGAGKSTLLKSLASLLKPLSGKIFYEERDSRDLSAKELAQKISVVLTDRVESTLNVYSLVSMGRYPYTSWTGTMADKDTEAIRKAIDMTGLHAFLDRPLYQLSDGERQKAMIARALAQDSPMILLDEPLAHLDIPNRMELLSLLRKLSHENGKTLLLSIHDLDAALQFADKIWLMDTEGNLEGGVPEDLILTQRIQGLFETPGLEFDMQGGSFRNLHAGKGNIYLDGPEPEKTWTGRACMRTGFAVVESRDAADYQIEIVKKDLSLRWEIEINAKLRKLKTIEELLDVLL